MTRFWQDLPFEVQLFLKSSITFALGVGATAALGACAMTSMSLGNGEHSERVWRELVRRNYFRGSLNAEAFGIRLASGARGKDIFTLVVSHGLRLMFHSGMPRRNPAPHPNSASGLNL